MEHTQVHELHNPDLLAYIPKTVDRIVEVGCSAGALAREYKRAGGRAHYTGIDAVATYADLARRHCDRVLAVDIEALDIDYLMRELPSDCWVFGDTLEHLRDPWGLLGRIRKLIGPGGYVTACIPNAQHWSMQRMLAMGTFRYQASGLLDRTHLRWFTRLTIAEMFHAAGFRITETRSRVFNEPGRAQVLPHIRSFAAAVGANPDEAEADAIPLQYVVLATAI